MHGKEEEDVYWFAGAIANTTAQIITYPIDLVRMLVQSNTKKISARDVVQHILEKQGHPAPAAINRKIGFSFGLRAATQRQMIYSIMRFGFYELGMRTESTEDFFGKVVIAGESGFAAGLLCTPLEKINVRMRTDILKPPDQRRNYPSAPKAVLRMYRQGGWPKLYRCGIVSSVRGMCLSMGQLAVYDELREMLFKTERFQENWHSCFLASLVAGSVTAIIITPADVVKLIFMDAKRGQYRCSMDVMRAIVQVYGFRGFYRGVLVSTLRIVPYTFLTFVFYELIRLEFNLNA